MKIFRLNQFMAGPCAIFDLSVFYVFCTFVILCLIYNARNISIIVYKKVKL